MARSNYQQVKQAIAERATFEGNSCSGLRFPDGAYRVKSYATIILKTDANGRVTMFDNRRYSVTTSKLQNIIRAIYPDATGGHDARVVYDYPTTI